MTYILGARCRDGVVIVADRKVVYDDGGVKYKRKLSNDYYPIVIGGAGPNAAIEDFEGRLVPITSKATHDLTTLVHEIEDAAHVVHKRYTDRYLNPFEVLLGIYVKDVGATLKHVYSEGFSCKVDSYKGIGIGEPYVAGLSNHLIKPEMTMEQVAEIGYFEVKYIQKFELNTGVGVDRKIPFDKPQIYYLYDKPPAGSDVVLELNDSVILERFENNAKKRLDKIEPSIVDSYSRLT